MAAAADLDADTRKYLSQATEAIIRCRLYGHAWDPTHDGYIVDGRGRDRVYTQQLQCMRCTSPGVDRFDPVTLERIKPRAIDYVDGYLLEGHNGTLSRREVRKWVASKAARSRSLRRVS